MSVVRAMLLADNQHAQRLHGVSVLAVCILSIVATTLGACASAIGCHCTRMPSKLPLWHCVVQACFVHAVFCWDVLDMMVPFCPCLIFETDVSSRFTTTHGPCDFLTCTSHWVHLTKIPALLRSSSWVNERTFFNLPKLQFHRRRKCCSHFRPVLRFDCNSDKCLSVASARGRKDHFLMYSFNNSPDGMCTPRELASHTWSHTNDSIKNVSA